MFVTFGTYHLRKKRRVTERGPCEICGRPNRVLSSYTASEWWHVMFIPLFPQGRHRYVLSCPTCRRCYKFPVKGSRLADRIAALRDEAQAHAGQDIDATLEDLRLMTHLGDFEGAAQLGAALESPADRAMADGQFASLQGDWERAESSFRRAVHADRSSSAARLYLGEFLITQKRDDEAITEFQRAAQLDPNCRYTALLCDYVPARKLAGNWNGLATLMGEVVRLHPDVLASDRKFAKLYAKACRKSGREDPALNPYAG